MEGDDNKQLITKHEQAMSTSLHNNDKNTMTRKGGGRQLLLHCKNMTSSQAYNHNR